MRYVDEKGGEQKKFQSKPTKRCRCKDREGRNHPWELADEGTGTIVKSATKMYWGHKASILGFPRQGVPLDARAVQDATTNDGETIYPHDNMREGIFNRKDRTDTRYNSRKRAKIQNPGIPQVCEALEWRSAKGSLKDASCRVVLLRLQREGIIQLPEAQERPCPNTQKGSVGNEMAEKEERECELSEVGEIRINSRYSKPYRIWKELMDRYHYLDSGMADLSFDETGKRDSRCTLYGLF